MPLFEYTVECKDIRPDGSEPITVTVIAADARTARARAEAKGRRMAARGEIRGTLISFSAKRGDRVGV